jgi:DNA-binding GntR family transcriptional regulator
MTTVAERIYAVLKADIINGRYRPGQHLREMEISEEMNTSRTPIREALRRLTAEQWVTQVPNSGVKVTEWDRDDDMEVFFSLRVLIEAFIAERAALMMSDEDLEQLENVQCEYRRIAAETPDETELLQKQNLLFHQALLDGAKSQWLKKIAGTLVTFPVLLATYESYEFDQIERSVRQHEDLINAIKIKSPELASSIMKAHILGAKASFLEK